MGKDSRSATNGTFGNFLAGNNNSSYFIRNIVENSINLVAIILKTQEVNDYLTYKLLHLIHSLKYIKHKGYIIL